MKVRLLAGTAWITWVLTGCGTGDEPVGGELKTNLQDASGTPGAEYAPAAPPITNAPPPGKPTKTGL